MNTLENPLTFVRSIKGAPASVLWALLLSGRPLTAAELSRWTGYGDENITAATRLLLDLGWVTARGPRGPWSLAPGRQYPLAAVSNPILSDSDPSSSSRKEIKDSILTNEEQRNEEQTKNPHFKESLHALYDAGIREPTAGRLAALPHVTPQYVQAHAEQARRQGLEVGTAIYRMLHAWPIPHPPSRLSVEDSISKFLGGPDE